MEESARERRGRRRRGTATPTPAPARRSLRYRALENPFPPIEILSADQVEHLHASALTILREHGIRVLLPEARALFREAGARVDEESMIVWLEAGARRSGPRLGALHLRAASAARPSAPSRSAVVISRRCR